MSKLNRELRLRKVNEQKQIEKKARFRTRLKKQDKEEQVNIKHLIKELSH